MGYVTYAPPPSPGDNTPILQGLIDDLGSTGGTVQLRGDVYPLGSELFVKNKVRLEGQGRSATALRAMSGFPDAPVVKLGGPSGFAFGARLSNLTVDANGAFTGVHSDHGQEMTGLSYVLVCNFTGYGVHLALGTDNYDVDNLELYPASSGATAGFYGEGNEGSCNLRRVTAGVSGPLDAGVWFKGSTVVAESIHAENCADGVLFDGANGSLIGATGPTSRQNVDNLVRMTDTSRYVTVQAVTKNSAKVAVRDDFFDHTITDPYVQLAVLGDAYMARMHVYGDRPVVTGSRGDGSAVASLLAALASLGLVADKTEP